jgi:PAS domain S-box-containing protein
MSTLAPAARRYIAALALGAFALTAVLVLQAGMLGRDDLLLACALGGLVTVAWLFPLPLSFKIYLYLDTSVLVAALLLLPPGWAMLIAGVGTALAHAIRRQDFAQTVFNTAQTVLQVCAGGIVLAAWGWDIDDPQFDDPRQIFLVLVAGAATLAVNQVAVAIMVGLQTGGVSPRDWARFVSHVDRGEHLAQLTQIGLGLMAAILVHTYPWTLALLLIPAGAVYASLSRAIQLQRRAEAALHDTEAALAEAQRVAELGSWDMNLATGEQLWSAELYRLLGFAPHAFLPTLDTLLRCVHPDDRAILDQAVNDAAAQGRPFDIEHRVRRQDGSERIVHERGEVVLDAQGKKVRLLGTVHDITERKQAEQTRDGLLAAVSHDLKNPLAVIRGHTQFLQLRMSRPGGVEPEQVAKSLATIDAAGEQMTAQLSELADVARLRMGQTLDLQLVPLDLVALARDRARFHQQATERHRLQVESDEAALPGRWDRQRLIRVIDNLLSNAVKYSPGGGEITVRVGRESADGADWAVLAVEDRGLGIPAADLALIWEPRRRGGNVGGIAGEGIGLAGARQIVVQHGGVVEVESREGRGSTFRIRLPLASGPAPDGAPSRQGEQGGERRDLLRARG